MRYEVNIMKRETDTEEETAETTIATVNTERAARRLQESVEVNLNHEEYFVQVEEVQ